MFPADCPFPRRRQVFTMKLSSTLLIFILAIAPFAGAQKVTQFEGIDASNDPVAGFTVDPNGAVGTKQYLEWVDQAYQGFDKVTGAAVWSKPLPATTPFSQNGMSDCTTGGGNGIILFDHLASVWIVAIREGGPNYFFCIAVSNTDDLTSSTFGWYTYELSLNPVLNLNGINYYPDYPKIATWPDAYYVTLDLENPTKGYQENGVVACAFDRTNMITGAAMRPPQCFSNSSTKGWYLAHSLLPADIDGTTPPAAGTPEAFVSIQNPATGSTTSNSLNIWQFHVDWNNPTNSTFTGPTPLTVPTYQPGCYSTSNPTDTYCVPEASTAQTKVRIDSVGDRLMHRFAFRQFPTYASYLVTHDIQMAPSGLQTGVRWYQLQSNNGVFSLTNSGTISPDKSYFRFVPSIAQDKTGNVAVGYSGSSTTIHPAIAFSYFNLPKNSSPKEVLVIEGTGDQENSSHWGGYTSMTVDPTDDCTFWYVNEYLNANQTGTTHTWKTRLAHFVLPGCS